jgi:hypothetical protein
MAQDFDIAVLGATPAGYAAAYCLATKGRQVILLDAPDQPAESSLADWAPREFFDIPGLPKGLEKDCSAKAFKQVVYHNSDLTKQVEYSTRATIGYFLNVKNLLASFRRKVVAAGVKIRSCRARPTVRLLEDHVELLSSPPARARLLLIAHNTPVEAVVELTLQGQHLPQPPMVVVALDVPVGAAGKSLQGTLHVIESRDRSDMGMFLVAGGQLHMRMISASVASGTRVAELSGLVAKLQRAGIVPANLPLSKATGAVWYPPAGMALELETHVAKRCMLIGTAGGFAESITGQTLFPSIKSAIIAADIAQAALDHAHTQEELMKYKTLWRKNLADYLRPPNTSLQMLLPLLFVNQQIVAKFTKALLFGDSI